MNKKAILLIIGLMSAALVGIAVLQVNWIRYAISLNEKKFDKSVRDALVSVAERLEEDQDRAAFSSLNGYEASYLQREISKNRNGKITVDISMGSLQQLWKNTDRNCSRCQDDRLRSFNQLRQWADYTEQASGLPIADRIPLDRLNTFLEREMTDRDRKSVV